MTYFTIGSDTELFAVDSAGKHRALCGLIGGTKEEPKSMLHGGGFACQEDNVAVEFNIPYADTKDYFVLCVSEAITEIRKKVNALGLDISKECAVSFDKTELIHPNALVFGCEPDYDAWKKVENKKPTSNNASLRTAGGHIHIGSMFDMVKGVRNMDLFLGVPSLLLDDSNGSVMRRELYGKAGAMRPKPYGWEYRTLSNFWVFDPKLVGWVFNATKKALNFQHTFTKKEEKIIVSCINTGDKEIAADLIKHYGLLMP